MITPIWDHHRKVSLGYPSFDAAKAGEEVTVLVRVRDISLVYYLTILKKTGGIDTISIHFLYEDLIIIYVTTLKLSFHRIPNGVLVF